MVIQRWQSVLLLIAVVMTALFSFCELAQIQGATQTVSVYSYGITSITENVGMVGTIYVTVVMMLACVLSFINIFLFKNTRLQKRVCLLCMVLVIAGVCSDYLAVSAFELPGATGIDYNSLAFITPAVALLALIGAFRCIRADERKLADSNRLI
ncbi:MAG: DUF4293 domain-containing protein [Prevotella sp.]|nr:DUF4293 domain-containing protein [Prevotella sp.]MCM1074716.1 DUF4293 domain-containing protein [Ruminococcus sp.]